MPCTVIPLLVVFVNDHESYFPVTTMLLYQLAGVLSCVVFNLVQFEENMLKYLCIVIGIKLFIKWQAYIISSCYQLTSQNQPDD